MEKISQFLIHCVPKRNIKKSLSSHNLAGKKEDVDNDSLDDEIEI